LVEVAAAVERQLLVAADDVACRQQREQKSLRQHAHVGHE
jgi:hypothetical protein